MTRFQKSKEILKIAIPSGLGSFLDIINMSITLIFIAKLSTSHIVALGAGASFMMLFYAIFAIFSTGSNATISRLYGQKSPQLKQAISSLLLSVLIASIPLMLLAFFSLSFYPQWLGLQSQSLNLTQLYLQILIFELPFLLLKTTLNAIFSASSKAKYPFYTKLLCTFFHLFLSYVLIFGLEGVFSPLGIRGAALSNLLCSILEVCLLCFFIYRIFGFDKKLSFQFTKNAIRIGFPTGIERGLTLFSLILIAKFLLSYGDEVLAGFQIGGRIESFVFMPGFGFMIASMSLMGQNAHHPDLAKSYTTLCLWISSFFMGTLGILIALIGNWIALFFTQDQEVLLYAWYYLVAVGLSQIPLIFIFVLDGALRGAGKSKFSLFINASSIWGLRILPMYLCSLYGFPYFFIFGIIFIETYLRAFIFWFVFYKTDWKIQS